METRDNGASVTEEDWEDDSEPTTRPADTEVNLGQLLGGQTGEEDSDDAVVPGGWTGSDDATSTAPSDLPIEIQRRNDPLVHREEYDPSGQGDGGELGGATGGVADITGSPVEGHHDLLDGPELAHENDARYH